MQSIQSVLKEQITNQNTVFVFPTDIACQKWADWVIKNTGVKAVAMDRFLAWDKFKGECIRSESENLRTIPSLMRKIFTDTLIQKNAVKPFFKSLIIEKYAGEASAFADWISSILPSLKMWKNLRDKQEEALSKSEGKINWDEEPSLKLFLEDYRKNDFTDSEDRDLEYLYEEYSRFLSDNGLFEPAWIEADFSGDGKEYYLIYPETLEDWEQYRYKLSNIEKIHFVSVPEAEGEYEAHFFENSSVEVKDVALFLRQMHDEQKIEWSDMAVNVPNLDTYGSYLDRELSLYEIPHSMRYSRPLSSYGAGILFSQLQDCVENNFSYESLKTLLLNEDLPWANKNVIENFLLFGRMNNCICTPEDYLNCKESGITVWNVAFDHPKDDRGTDLNKDELIRNFYKSLIKYIPPLVKAQKFEDIRKKYEDFREKFFDMAAFQTMELSNNVLSRCITSLNELVDLEKDYPEYHVANPYSFFVSYLSKVQYLTQGENRALQVYPYKSAPAAPYKVHVVLDSTQDSLSVASGFKPLDFMNENKRALFMKMGELDSSLGFQDSDPSFDFVKLYQHSALCKSYFTASRHAYNGEYGFAYGKLSKMGKEEKLFRPDAFADEKVRFLSVSSPENLKGAAFPGKVFSSQGRGLDSWKKIHQNDKSDDGLFSKDEKLTSMIQKRLRLLREDSDSKKEKNPLLLNRIEVTQTTLKNYFKCPRKWLFKNVLSIAPLDNEAELIDEYILGTVNHKVFENFFESLREEKLLLAYDEERPGRLGENFSSLLVKAINAAVDPEDQSSAFKEIYSSRYSKKIASSMTVKVLSSQYKIGKGENPEENANFRMLEKSIAGLCSIYKGYKVYATELNLEALPQDENGTGQEGYYLAGKIDCILSSSNESEFVVIDYKTTSTPTNLTVKAQNDGKKENIIDFQLPLYIYLLENSLQEELRLKVSAALFYSIKKAEARFFLGSAPEGKPNKITEEDVNLAKAEMLKYAKRFYTEVSDEKFAVNVLNQGRTVCTAKGEFDNCIDYQAVCRRYFMVSGEEGL